MTVQMGIFPRTAPASVLAAAMVALLAAGAFASGGLRFEAEEFEAYGSYNIGGADIAVSYCSYASGGLAVDGLDVPGEWFKLKVTISSGACYSSRMDYQSAYGDTTQLAVRLLDYPHVGDELRSDYLLVDGYGYG
jgi:hypothetical protein